MNMMKKLGVQPMVMLKGQAGMYFKFADGLSTNAEPVEFFFKPKFIKFMYLVEKDNLQLITWLELNVLWVGPPNMPDFDGEFSNLRSGKYVSKDGQYHSGYLLAKVMVPMGNFNDNMPVMHQWLVDHCEDVQKFLQEGLLSQVNGTVCMPLLTVFDFMNEGVSKDTLIVPDTKVYTNEQFSKLQKEYGQKAAAKYLPKGNPVGDDDEQGDGSED